MNYIDLLNYFIKLTNIKIGHLATYLNYDISYISKWIHGKRRPSRNNIIEINNKLAKIFAQHIIEKNLLDTVINDLDFSLVTSGNETLIFASLEKNIYDYLNLSYDNKLKLEKKSTHKEINYIIGQTEIENSLVEIFRYIFTNKKDNLNIWINISILSNFSKFLINLISNYMDKKQNININFLYSRKFIINDVRNIFQTIEKYPNINFKIYENNSFENLSFISIDKYFFADISFKEDSMLTMTYSFDPIMANKFSMMATNHSYESNKIISMSESSLSVTSDFLTSFYTKGSRYTVLLNYGLEYMIPESLLKELTLSNNLNTGTQIFFHRVNEILKDFFEKSNVNILIPTNILKKCFKENFCYFYTYKFQLNEDLSNQYIDNIIKILKENPKFHIYIIDEDEIYETFPYSNINIYYNDNFSYFKKISKYDLSASSSYTVESKLFNDIISKDLKRIISNTSTKELKYYELRKMYKEIKKLK